MRDSLEVFSLRARRAVLWFLTATYLIIYIKRIAAETPSRNFYRKVSKEIKCVKENFIVICCCTTKYN